MIELTKLNGEDIIINADMIENIRSRPDTLITLSNGDYIMVKEKRREVMDKVIAYKKKINSADDRNPSKLEEEEE